ncbi:hypothetical protein PHLCEN_2v12399 [Hermanssonia centrifuga]|uniref:Uncharacterized protein n=1 Tax=Hermanssonia centrifuga TaxID=98765 RepID=A0A2R6NH59_9APHY|nr:hypothetical protein PHLCEN_2v12399 [Hermanssonia centrifuga]
MGQTENGIYEDECEGMHPDTINRYYGVDCGSNETRRRQSHTGAGHPPDESDLDSDSSDNEDNTPSIGDRIAHDQQPNIRHEPIPVPDNFTPFVDEDSSQLFHDTWEVYKDINVLPPNGYGVHEDEMEEGGYESFEILRMGKRGGKEMTISLPEHIWRRRAEQWAKGLYLMNHIVYSVDNSEQL